MSNTDVPGNYGAKLTPIAIKEVKRMEYDANNVSLICCDIDGTLLNKQREVDDFTKKVFGLLNDRVKVILASSRMPKALYHIQDDLLISGSPMICYNGGLILSGGNLFSEAQIVKSFTIPENIITDIIKSANKYQLHVSLYYNDTWIATALDDWSRKEINNTKVKPDRYFGPEFLNDGDDKIKHAHKIMLMGDPEKITVIEQHLKPQQQVALCRSKETYLEITPPNTNKSLALKLLIDSTDTLNGIDTNNIIAFGDNHNDYELLNDVKYGIAVGNAVMTLKDVAYAVTKSNVDNGVACYLNEFFHLSLK